MHVNTKNPYQAVEEDGLEGCFASELQPHHDHAGNPEEQNVMARLHHSGGVESGEIRV